MSYVLAGAAVVTAGVGAYKAIKGANQSAAANRLAKSNTFTPEEMPYEVGLGTDLAQRNYTNGMPGYGEAVNNINRNGASSFYRGSQGATSGGDLLDLATRIGQGTNLATNQLNTQQQQYKAGALGQYEGALQNQANWQKQLYNNNTLQPYLRTANLAASMYGAGQQNEYSGIDDISSAAIGYAKGYQRQPNTDTQPAPPGGNWGADLSRNPNFAYGAQPDIQPAGYGNLSGNPVPYTQYKMPAYTNWQQF